MCRILQDRGIKKSGTDVSVADGGTGVSSVTAFGLLAGGTTTTSAFQSLSTGTANHILLSGGTGALPSWSTATYPGTATGTGTILKSSIHTSQVIGNH